MHSSAASSPALAPAWKAPRDAPPESVRQIRSGRGMSRYLPANARSRTAPAAVALPETRPRGGDLVQHEHTEHIAGSPDAVFAAISDVSNLPRFVPQMTAARPAADHRVEVDARYQGRKQHGEA